MRTVEPRAVEAFQSLILRTANLNTGIEEKAILEEYKKTFCAVAGEPYYPSTSRSWAESDLRSMMDACAQNMPTFLEGMWLASERLAQYLEKKEITAGFIPSPDDINHIVEEQGLGYVVDPPRLRLRDKASVSIEIEPRLSTLSEKAAEAFEESMLESQRLLTTGKPRQAVQEALWLLESVSTIFEGLEVENGSIKGSYFNDIAKEIKAHFGGTTLTVVSGWITKMHGYLSSTRGGGVRHGTDFKDLTTLTPNEARLFCEPPRVCWRLQTLRTWSHEHITKVLPRGAGASCSNGIRARA